MCSLGTKSPDFLSAQSARRGGLSRSIAQAIDHDASLDFRRGVEQSERDRHEKERSDGGRVFGLG
jgi:hypothetical protein